ncbi:NAD(P)H-dependent oxidoreductase [Candidatus Gracilibacteria bacterium]|nr:NAD(P)H-dependent oxidoreductase [Candidatus Gracilibacteria bacterium]
MKKNKISIIVGSASLTSKTVVLAKHIQKKLQDRGLQIEFFNQASEPLPLLTDDVLKILLMKFLILLIQLKILVA